MAKNLKSVLGLENVVLQKFEKEIEGRVAEPFFGLFIGQFMHFHNTLGIVPKKAKGEYRLIYRLSYPHGDLVNDGIRDELASVHSCGNLCAFV